ncbi:unnamed protein product [Ambrosiozyma monospora]|uniref:Unnamed protein product n=1 Tax=Ambrosiozyma monospora TaxID=43982 RepID=A0ACB5T3S3_AMBMO|nr:unnamed protein product [Ambrosiozyma monospora]
MNDDDDGDDQESSVSGSITNSETTNDVHHERNDSGPDSDDLPVMEISLDGIGLTVEDFEVILKRLYCDPDIEYKKKESLTFLKAGDFFGFPDLARTTLLYSKNACVSDCLELIKTALGTDYGEHSIQCMSGIFDRFFREFEALKSAFIGNSQFDVFHENISIEIPCQLEQAILICKVIKNLKVNRHWKYDIKAETILGRTLCNKIRYSDMPEPHFRDLLTFVDEEQCPYVNSKVVVDYVSLHGNFF